MIPGYELHAWSAFSLRASDYVLGGAVGVGGREIGLVFSLMFELGVRWLYDRAERGRVGDSVRSGDSAPGTHSAYGVANHDAGRANAECACRAEVPSDDAA